MELNLLKLPDSPDTIHVIPGLSGPGSQDYNNLNVIYRQLVSLLEENDILFLGGDFVNMCMNCCSVYSERNHGRDVSLPRSE